MTNSRTLTSVIVAAILLVAAFAVFYSGYNHPFQASAAGGDPGDFSTTTTSAFASGSATTQLKSRPGILGSVIISSSSPVTAYSQITIYDATSTMATSTATVLARFGAGNQTMGTYMFDAAAAYGLKLEVPVGYNGNATITWR